VERTRTLIIGLDGATLDLIKPWAKAGHLPAFARLMAEGVQGTLLAWPNMNSAAAWTSMVTGCNPGQHGIYGFGRLSGQDATTWQPVSAADRKRDPFWRLLSAAGRRVGVINVPLTYPAEAIDGFMLSGSDSSGIGGSGLAHPAGLLDNLRKQGIKHILDVPNLARLSRRAPREVPLPLQQMVDARSRSILHLMRTEPWDVLMAVFVATDRVQHHFWPTDQVPMDDPAWTPIRRTYQQIDAFLHDALTLVGRDTTVMVVSDHGFGPQRPVLHHLNTLLAQLGLLHFCGDSQSPDSTTLKKLLVLGRKWLPLQLQGPLARAFPGLHLRAMSDSTMLNVDWSKTQAFIDPLGGQLRINLQGRQREGIVPPHAYQQLRDRLQRIMRQLREPGTGLELAQAVHTREEVYHGPYAHLAEDLLIRWKEDFAYNALRYEAEGKSLIVRAPDESAAEGRGRGWSGTHRPEGVFLLWGPRIRQRATIEGITGYDIAPTVLYLQNHPIPPHIDGQVLVDIFE
jgi:predicted AlkP superfamily phosphohydrolase/phosphomutase